MIACNGVRLRPQLDVLDRQYRWFIADAGPHRSAYNRGVAGLNSLRGAVSNPSDGAHLHAPCTVTVA